jgi:hypothetical protein
MPRPRRAGKDGDRSRVGRVRLAVQKGILLRGVGQFVDETLDDEDVMGQADATPERGLNRGRFDAHVLHAHVGKRIRRVCRTVDHVELEAVLER